MYSVLGCFSSFFLFSLLISIVWRSFEVDGYSKYVGTQGFVVVIVVQKYKVFILFSFLIVDQAPIFPFHDHLGAAFKDHKESERLRRSKF